MGGAHCLLRPVCCPCSLQGPPASAVTPDDPAAAHTLPSVDDTLSPDAQASLDGALRHSLGLSECSDEVPSVASPSLGLSDCSDEALPTVASLSAELNCFGAAAAEAAAAARLPGGGPQGGGKPPSSWASRASGRAPAALPLDALPSQEGAQLELLYYSSMSPCRSSCGSSPKCARHGSCQTGTISLLTSIALACACPSQMQSLLL